MYKIYVNDTPLLLMNTRDSEKHQVVPDHTLVARYAGKKKLLLPYIDMLEKTDKFAEVILHAQDYEGLVEDFKSLYKIIEAAGGAVFNEEEELLMIYRLNTWDLPKGKIDEGEEKEAAALREVTEETGITNIKLGELLTTTYHTYKNGKGKRILKRTYWFRMTALKQELIPEKAENIEKAVWIKPAHFLAETRAVYKSILDVLSKVSD